MKSRYWKYFLDGMGDISFPVFVPGAKSRAHEAGWESAARSWQRIGESMWAALGDVHEEIERCPKDQRKYLYRPQGRKAAQKKSPRSQK